MNVWSFKARSELRRLPWRTKNFSPVEFFIPTPRTTIRQSNNAINWAPKTANFLLDVKTSSKPCRTPQSSIMQGEGKKFFIAEESEVGGEIPIHLQWERRKNFGCLCCSLHCKEMKLPRKEIFSLLGSPKCSKLFCNPRAFSSYHCLAAACFITIYTQTLASLSPSNCSALLRE